MSKKDFELIARVLRQAHNPMMHERTVELLVHDFATALAQTNPRFNHAKFIDATKVQS